jgi:hypothetical protein
MVYTKQFLTKTRPSDNTSVFRYSPSLSLGNVEIYALVSVSNTAEVETSRFNKFVWDGFLDGFLSKEDEIIVRLKNGLLGAEFKLKELIKHDSVLEEKGVNLNISILVFKENKVFVGISGDHNVFVYRKKIVDISGLLANNKSDVGSMIMLPKDIFVVCACEKNLKSDIENLQHLDEIEGYIAKIFEREGATGGAFVATMQEKKIEVKAPPPVLEEKTIETEIVEEEPEEIVELEKEPNEKWLWFKGKVQNIFGKIITFFSYYFNKLPFWIENKYGRKKWLKKLQSKSSFSRMEKGVRPFKVDGYKDRELKVRRFVTFFVLLVLVLAIFLGVRSAFESRQRAVLSRGLDAFFLELDEVLGDADRKALSDSEESLNLLASARKDLDEYLNDLESKGQLERLGSENEEKIEERKSKLQSIEDKIFRIVAVSEEAGNIEVFLDTKLTFGDKSDPVTFVISKGSQIVHGEFLYLIDKGEGAVFEVSLVDASYRKVTDPNNFLKNPIHIDIGNNVENEGLYVFDSESGVLRAGKDADGKFNDFKVLSGVNAKSLGAEGVSAFAVFGPLDSLNFLIPSQSRIMKSDGFGGGGYSLPSEYISHPSFENGTDLFGDQYVIVLSETPNGIKRFVPSTGLNRPLSVTGLHEDLKNITHGYTGPTMDRALVVFDSKLERFVRFSKPIEAVQNPVHPNEVVVTAQYVYRGEAEDAFNDVKGVVLTDNDNTMYVLDGRKIWKINIVLD